MPVAVLYCSLADLWAYAVWPGWEVVELNPAQVSEQRRVMGRRRVKTDAIDLEAITELLLAGRGYRVGAPDFVTMNRQLLIRSTVPG